MAINQEKLNKRQDQILHFIDVNKQASISEILKSITGTAKITINRDLKKLLDLGLIITKGKGRSVVYELSLQYNLFKLINIDDYFKIEYNKRQIKERFNFEIFSHLKDFLTKQEKEYLKNKNQEYQKNIKNFSSTLLKKEFERLTIELSWKSSQIEGNTYSLLETEYLIKENKESSGHTREEAIMILNHKKALDYIRESKAKFKNISLAKIESVHSLLMRDLGIARNLRERAVGITGTKYMPLDNQFQIREAIEKTCKLINKQENAFAKAIIIMLLIAYIQPFEDGNKRASRLLGNAVLMAHDICPLSYKSINELDYKKAVILFYEQNNINFFKKLFTEQLEFAVNNYFLLKNK